jgi:hypothetical protein
MLWLHALLLLSLRLWWWWCCCCCGRPLVPLPLSSGYCQPAAPTVTILLRLRHCYCYCSCVTTAAVTALLLLLLWLQHCYCSCATATAAAAAAAAACANSLVPTLSPWGPCRTHRTRDACKHAQTHKSHMINDVIMKPARGLSKGLLLLLLLLLTCQFCPGPARHC